MRWTRLGLRTRAKTKTYYAEAQAWDDASSPRCLCPTIKFLPQNCCSVLLLCCYCTAIVGHSAHSRLESRS
jgi:hypothetical protein